MFCVSEVEATAIREAFERGGALSAAVELRRLFPGLVNNEATTRAAVTIAGWLPQLPIPAVKARRSRRVACSQ